MIDTINMKVEEVRELCTRALTSAGTIESAAEIVAQALVQAEIDGQEAHGVSRTPSYAAQVKTAKVNGKAVPAIEHVKPGMFRVNADYGFAYPAIDLALPELAARAQKNGIAAAAIYHSHHFGVAGHPCEKLAEKGFVAFIYGNSPKAIAPYGGKEKILGTNPIAFGAPSPGDPLVIDMAVSVAARGKIVSARQKGIPIEEGWALDAQGEPTTDPEKALSGSLVPAGGAKGAALALMVEVMSACLAGAALGTEAGNLFDSEGPPPDLGQVLLAIDAAALSDDRFMERMAFLTALYEQTEGARFPGTKRLERRKKTAKSGMLDLPGPLVRQIEKLAEGG